MNRLEQFEAVLAEVQSNYNTKCEQLSEMRAQGKEKSATFKQYMADKLIYARMLAIFEKHNLLSL